MIIGRHEIHFVDFHRWWQKINDGTIDLILTDPPYGLQLRKFEWDIKPDFAVLAWIFHQLLTHSGAIAIIHNPALTSELELAFAKYFVRKYIEVWLKPSALVKHKDRPKPDLDFVSVFYRKRGKMADHVFNWEEIAEVGEPWKRKNKNLENTTLMTKKRRIDVNESGLRHPSSYIPVVNRPAMTRVEMEGVTHPMQKDISAVTRLIKLLSNPGDLVLDPYMGSGTTMVAAERTARRSIGFEIDESNYLEAEARLANEVCLAEQVSPDGG